MTGFRALLAKELLEQWRTLRLPLVTVVFLLVGFGSPLLARFTPELVKMLAGTGLDIRIPTPTAIDAFDQLLKNLGQFGTLVAILLAMGSIAGEKERGTAALLLVTRASRPAFLAAKLVALGITLAIATAAAGAVDWIYTGVLFTVPPIGPFVVATALLWLQLAAFAALTFLGSTLTRSALAAAGFGFALLIVLAVLGALPVVGSALPSGLPATARALVVGGEVDWRPAVTSAALIAIVVAAATVSFSREEL